MEPTEPELTPEKSAWLNPEIGFEKRARLLVAAMTWEEKIGQLNYRNPAIPRLGVLPYVWWNEALHGLARSGAATVFPQAIGMAATFNTERVSRMADIIAKEGRARHHESLRRGDFGTYKGLTYWSPNVNIFRDPRWGRGHETYGEDPFLTARMGVAYVEGLQGKHPRFLQAVATPKHFAVHSGPELTRLSFNSVADERDLRETYLPAFPACIEAGAQSIMTAYNAYNGEPCATNRKLLRKVLRKEWGFDGVIVTDAGAPEALYEEHKTVPDLPTAVAKVINSGVDVAVGFSSDLSVAIVEADERGLFEEAEVDRAVYNQLLVKLRLGMFDDPSEVPLADSPYECIECPEHLEEARQACRESLVLLKNDRGFLPLEKEAISNIGVIGPNADARDILLGNYHGTPTRQITILEGIQRAVSESCRVWHGRGCEHLSSRTEVCAEDDDRYAEAAAIASRSDIVVLCLGLNPSIEGEAGDAFNAEAGGDKLQVELPACQEKLIETVVETGTSVVVLMFAGSSVVSPTLERLGLPLLHCWYPGAEAGDVVAATIFGDENPAGRLPLTFYRNTSDLPPFEEYSMENRTYRFFSGQPAYPFGYGLSYTNFGYEDLRIKQIGKDVVIQVGVANLGERKGDEVIQVYAHWHSEERVPIRELKAFQRLSLPPRGREEISFTIPVASLSLIDAAGRRYPFKGVLRFSVGGSQPDPRSVELMGRAPLKGELDLDGA
ncbi:MAG: glycoside hydrolase family 3 N-terminal domain-containing protein [Verrucomicrobiota bacterium]